MNKTYYMLSENEISNFQGFSKLNRKERLDRLLAIGALTADEVEFLQTSVNPIFIDLADTFIENAIGCFPLPLGIATNFLIDGQDYIIPMAVEETSIIAAASKIAKWIREEGSINTSIKGNCIIGQIHVPHVNDWQNFSYTLDHYKTTLIEEIHQNIAKNLVARGGGIHDILLRKIPINPNLPKAFRVATRRKRGRGAECIEKYMSTETSLQQSRSSKSKGYMGVIHILLDPCDAMGANLISQICESLKPRIEQLTKEKLGICILSNLTDTKLTQAEIIIRNIDPQIGLGIQQASDFAIADPHRAATHNKGILNGIDAVLIATGNDWRAVEAGVHAYAAQSGQYQPVSRWKMQGNDLHGFFEAPVIVGTVGGVTRNHPTAQLCLKLLGIQSAEQLSRIAAAVGLVQNLGALRALSQEGICQGHMRLHIDNLLMAAGASPKQIPLARIMMQQILEEKKNISVSDAKTVLELT